MDAIRAVFPISLKVVVPKAIAAALLVDEQEGSKADNGLARHMQVGDAEINS